MSILIEILRDIFFWQALSWKLNRRVLDPPFQRTFRLAVASDLAFLVFMSSGVWMLCEFWWRFRAQTFAFPVLPFGLMVLTLWIYATQGQKIDAFLSAYKRTVERVNSTDEDFVTYWMLWRKMSEPILTRKAEKEHGRNDKRTETARMDFREAYADFLLLELIQDEGYGYYFKPSTRLT